MCFEKKKYKSIMIKMEFVWILSKLNQTTFRNYCETTDMGGQKWYAYIKSKRMVIIFVVNLKDTDYFYFTETDFQKMYEMCFEYSSER